MISFSRATVLAQAWMKEQMDLPIYTYPFVRPYDSQLNGRTVTIVVTVRFTATGEVKMFDLVQLLATDAETLIIRKDRRRYVEKLLEAAKHEFIKGSSHKSYDNFDAYQIFCEAISDRGDAPDWFETIELQSGSAQSSGYDCWAYITTLSETSARVPVKIFCNKRERANYNRHKSAVHVQRMVTLVVAEEQNPESTRGRLYHLLQQMRDQRIYQ